MSRKSDKIARLIDGCRGQALDAHYLGYFECFNQGLYFEAHDVLEELWLRDRTSPNYNFHKALIQLAGAFVHLQKNRLKPAAALFRLSRSYLSAYPSPHEALDLQVVRGLIETWLGALEAGEYLVNPLPTRPAPILRPDC